MQRALELVEIGGQVRRDDREEVLLDGWVVRACLQGERGVVLKLEMRDKGDRTPFVHDAPPLAMAPSTGLRLTEPNIDRRGRRQGKLRLRSRSIGWDSIIAARSVNRFDFPEELRPVPPG